MRESTSASAEVELERVPSRRERKKAERRQAIYETAIKLFTERGFDAVTVDDITEAVDIGKGTFFNYFPTKEHILHEYRDRFYDDILAFADGLDGESGRELLRRFLRRACRHVVREGERFRMFHRATSAISHLHRTDDERIAAVHGHYQRMLRICADAGEVAPQTDLQLLMEILIDVWRGNLQTWILDDQLFSLEGRMLQKLDLIFDHP
jgi:AcrR family transcriptional regulator